MNDLSPQNPYVLPTIRDGARRPRIALMGEFSAGKSTLANLMIGSDPLPVQVIATQLPPVWISYGSAPAVIVDVAGNEMPCDMETLQDISPEETAFIRIYCEEEILKLCDIIDMPGISDPNMSSDVWERLMPLADGIIWCSASTQAWRQSEAAVWEGVDPKVQAHSLLLLTRADMLVKETDRAKVLKRVTVETQGKFKSRIMISLLQARDSDEDTEAWAQSGAEPFVNEFLSILGDLADAVDGQQDIDPIAMIAAFPQNASSDAQKTGDSTQGERVLPRRPVAKAARARPEIPVESLDDNAFMPKFS